MAHTIPGRTRLRLPAERRGEGPSLAERFAAVPEVRSARWSAASRSLAVRHDPAVGFAEVVAHLPDQARARDARRGRRRRHPRRGGSSSSPRSRSPPAWWGSPRSRSRRSPPARCRSRGAPSTASPIRVAVPTSILTTMINAARNDIIFKQGRAIEDLARVTTVIFDKTGTLTSGRPAVVDMEVHNGLAIAGGIALAYGLDALGVPIGATLLALRFIDHMLTDAPATSVTTAAHTTTDAAPRRHGGPRRNATLAR